MLTLLSRSGADYVQRQQTPERKVKHAAAEFTDATTMLMCSARSVEQEEAQPASLMDHKHEEVNQDGDDVTAWKGTNHRRTESFNRDTAMRSTGSGATSRFCRLSRSPVVGGARVHVSVDACSSSYTALV